MRCSRSPRHRALDRPPGSCASPGRRARRCSTTPTEACWGPGRDRRGRVRALPADWRLRWRRLVGHLRTADLRACRRSTSPPSTTAAGARSSSPTSRYGDTRRRGVALVQFKQAYRRAGVELDARRAARPPVRRTPVRRGRGRGGSVGAAARPPGRRGDAAAGAGRGRLTLARRGGGAVPDAAGARGRGGGRRTPADRGGAARRAGRACEPTCSTRRSRSGRRGVLTLADRGSIAMTDFLWVIVPYICLGIFVVGHFWRYHYDKFGWTTRSCQLYEDRCCGSAPAVPLRDARRRRGHIIGLLVPGPGPRRWASRGHLPPGRGRRRPARRGDGLGRHGDPDLPAAHRRPGLLRHHGDGQGDVRLPRRRDRPGLWNTIAARSSRSAVIRLPGGRVGLVPLVPRLPAPTRADGRGAARLPAARPGGLRTFALWPFTRLVHVFSAPVGYLTRP